MRPAAYFGTLCLLVLLCAAPARAEIDHLCLRQCIANGGNSPECMKRCSYGVDDSRVKPSKPDPSPHRIFDTPLPARDNAVVAKKPSAVPPEINYICLKDCLKNSVTYGFCEKKCAKPPSVLSPSKAQ